MWADACARLDRAERLHRQFFRPGMARARPTWEPPVDLFETEHDYRLVIALPGVKPEQVQLLLDGRTLVVVGERTMSSVSGDPPGQALVHRLELPYGRFERRIDLPSGRLALGRHELADGCLLVILSKS
jgi:HSP20 family molecular chaperone IbpA